MAFWVECRISLPYTFTRLSESTTKEHFIHFLFRLTSIWDFTWFHSVLNNEIICLLVCVWWDLFIQSTNYTNEKRKATRKVSETIKNIIFVEHKNVKRISKKIDHKNNHFRLFLDHESCRWLHKKVSASFDTTWSRSVRLMNSEYVDSIIKNCSCVVW
jgi:hypothetical protein